MKRRRTVVLSIVGLLAVVSVAAQGDPANNPSTNAVVDANGNLKVPADYRTSHQFLGSWARDNGWSGCLTGKNSTQGGDP